MDGQETAIVLELTRQLPTLLWFAFALVVFLLLRKQLSAGLLTRLSKVNIGGIALEFAEDAINSAVKTVEENHGVRLEGYDGATNIVRRAASNISALQGSIILWVDDNPSNNQYIASFFRQFGIFVHDALDSQSAHRFLKTHRVDLVISDIERYGDETAGLEFAKQLASNRARTPLIFFIGRMDNEKPTPQGAFGITDRPDQLVQLTMDILERHRY